MEKLEYPKTFDEFLEVRKQGFIKVKKFKENGGRLAFEWCDSKGWDSHRKEWRSDCLPG